MCARRRGALVAEAEQAPVAVLFGSERTGLTNEELDARTRCCAFRPTRSMPSLNLAHGGADRRPTRSCVRGTSAARRGRPPRSDPTPGRAAGHAREAMEQLYAHLAEVLEEIDFRDRTQSGTHLMKRMRRLLQRAEPDANEVNILRGILTAVQQRGAVVPAHERVTATGRDAGLSRLRGHHAGGSARGRRDERVPDARWGRSAIRPRCTTTAGSARARVEQARAQAAALIGAPRRS